VCCYFKKSSKLLATVKGFDPVSLVILSPLGTEYYLIYSLQQDFNRISVLLLLSFRVVGGLEALTAMENVESDPKTDKPKVILFHLLHQKCIIRVSSVGLCNMLYVDS